MRLRTASMTLGHHSRPDRSHSWFPSTTQGPVEIHSDKTRLDGCMLQSPLAPRPDVALTAVSIRLPAETSISHVDDGRRIRAASLRCGRCEMWCHRAWRASARSFHASAGVEIQGTWLQVAGLSRFGFPFGGPTPPTTPSPIAECATRRSPPAHAAATASRIFPPPSHGCPTARVRYNQHPGNANQCQHASCYVLSRGLARETKQTPGCSLHKSRQESSGGVAESRPQSCWSRLGAGDKRQRQRQRQLPQSTTCTGIKVVRSTGKVEASLAMGHSDCILLMHHRS